MEDSSRNRFHRIGFSEYALLSLFDGDTTVHQAVALAARELGRDAFTESEAIDVCRWALEQGVLLPESGAAIAPAPRQASLLNPFWMRAPFGNPERTLAVLQPLLGWIHSTGAVLAGALLLLLASAAMATEWPRLASQAGSMLDAANWWRLGLVWIGLKVVHEMSHALACRRYGGRVTEAGLVLVLFAPMAYVDVTSSWRFSSKWRRMHVAAAGIWIELLIASAAILYWAADPADLSRRWMLEVAAMAGASTLLFNLNPLMKFDGYYLLSDLLAIPNLAASGQAFVQSCWARLFLGHPWARLPESGWRAGVIRGYGIAAGLWRIAVAISLTLAASVLLQGFGVLLAAAAVLMWTLHPLLRGARALRKQWEVDPGPVIFGSVSSLVVLSVFGLAVLVLPCPGSLQAPGVVAYSDLAVVRAGAAGFVKQVHVQAGEVVSRGDLLLQLENDELRLQRDQLLLKLEQADARRQRLLHEREVAAAQVEERNAASLRLQLAQLQRQLDGLQVRAPRNGRVLAHGLEQLPGIWAKEGEELLAIGEEAEKEVQFAVSQLDVEQFAAALGTRTTVRIPGRGQVQGTLTRVAPRASDVPPHPSLTAVYGGPLPAQRREADDSRLEARLSAPHFTAVIRFDPAASAPLKAGERADARLDAARPPAAIVMYRAIDRWVREKWRTTQLESETASVR